MGRTTASELNDAGHYAPNLDVDPMRIFTELDPRVVLEDLYAKLQLYACASD
jgi:hypothetical protein